jgi:hypothetical protein
LLGKKEFSTPGDKKCFGEPWFKFLKVLVEFDGLHGKMKFKKIEKNVGEAVKG